VKLTRARAKLTKDKEEAFSDIVSEGISMEDNAKKVDEYLTSVISNIQRLPPFSYLKIDGYSYLRI
jgi:hypothetical protein